MQVYHYTTPFRWFIIRKITKRLLPRSPYSRGDISFDNTTKNIVGKNKKFIVCLDDQKIWKKYGLLDYQDNAFGQTN